MLEVEVLSVILMMFLNSIRKLQIWDTPSSVLKKKTINLEAQWEKWLTTTRSNLNLETRTYEEWKWINQLEESTINKNWIYFNKKTEA